MTGPRGDSAPPTPQSPLTYICPHPRSLSLYGLPPQVSIGIDPASVFNEADWALMIGAKPRGPGMERADLLNQNGEIFQAQVCACVGAQACTCLVTLNSSTRRAGLCSVCTPPPGPLAAAPHRRKHAQGQRYADTVCMRMCMRA